MWIYETYIYYQEPEYNDINSAFYLTEELAALALKELKRCLVKDGCIAKMRPIWVREE